MTLFYGLPVHCNSIKPGQGRRNDFMLIIHVLGGKINLTCTSYLPGINLLSIITPQAFNIIVFLSFARKLPTCE